MYFTFKIFRDQSHRLLCWQEAREGITQQKGDDVIQCCCCWKSQLCLQCDPPQYMFCGDITDLNGLVCLVKPCQTLVRLSELFLQEHCGSSFIFRKKFCSIHKDIFSIVQRIL